LAQFTYKKHAFICHRSGSNSAERGHYVAYTKSGSRWWLCNDSTVTESPTGSMPHAAERLYLAVYERVAELPPPPPPPPAASIVHAAPIHPPLPLLPSPLPPPAPAPAVNMSSRKRRFAAVIEAEWLDRLKEGGQLNDGIIAWYLSEILASRFPHCLYLDPAFYTTLATRQQNKNSLFRWFKNDLSQVRKVQ
jgi:hypothetical protein